VVSFARDNECSFPSSAWCENGGPPLGGIIVPRSTELVLE